MTKTRLHIKKIKGRMSKLVSLSKLRIARRDTACIVDGSLISTLFSSFYSALKSLVCDYTSS